MFSKKILVLFWDLVLLRRKEIGRITKSKENCRNSFAYDEWNYTYVIEQFCLYILYFAYCFLETYFSKWS